MIERDEEEDHRFDDDAEDAAALDEPVTVADAVALLSTFRTMLASWDGMLRHAIRDLVGEDVEEEDEKE